MKSKKDITEKILAINSLINDLIDTYDPTQKNDHLYKKYQNLYDNLIKFKQALKNTIED